MSCALDRVGDPDNTTIKILIVEDSEAVTRLLTAIFDEQPDMLVVGCAADGGEAVRLVAELRPDVVAIDNCLPVMDGAETTRAIMATNPTPIVVIASPERDEHLRPAFRAIEEGALAIVEKPVDRELLEYEQRRREIVGIVRAMASVRVVRRRQPNPVRSRTTRVRTRIAPATRARQVVAIGSSTGGPQALQAILCSLPIDFPAPILVVQHISNGFIGGMIDWLQGHTLLHVTVASDRERLQAGTVYFAPDDYHVCVTFAGGNLRANLRQDAEVNRFRPSVTVLLESVATSCPGKGIGGLLSGMGKDGAVGLLMMREAKCATFVQDKASATVHGMAGAALTLGAVDQVVELHRIAEHLTELAAR